MKRKEVPSDSDTTFQQPSSFTDGAERSPSVFTRPRPRRSKLAKEERRLAALMETAALTQATAAKAIADAKLKKMTVLEIQNTFMLMNYSFDGVISETAARYFKLRQEEEAFFRQRSKHATEERRVTALRETAAAARASAMMAMADATLMEAKVIEGQNLFMLMTFPFVDGKISETATKYLKLRQKEELKKLETRLRALSENVRQSPLPIPVETDEGLRRRVAAALGSLPRSRAQHRRPSSMDSGHGAGIPIGGSPGDFRDTLHFQAEAAVDGATAAAVEENGEELPGSDDDVHCDRGT